MNNTRQLKALFGEIISEAERNPAFAERLRKAMDRFPELLEVEAMPKEPITPAEPTLTDEPKHARQSGRRPSGVINPYELYVDGEDRLRDRLSELHLEQLKDIVAEHGMDTMRLAMKWKTPERLVDLIVATVAARSRKGDAFRG